MASSPCDPRGPETLPRNGNNASDAKPLHQFTSSHGVAPTPHNLRKKEIPGTVQGKKFAVLPPAVVFTRRGRRFSSSRMRVQVRCHLQAVPERAPAAPDRPLKKAVPPPFHPRRAGSESLGNFSEVVTFTMQALVLISTAPQRATRRGNPRSLPRLWPLRFSCRRALQSAPSKLEHEPCLTRGFLACPLHLSFRVL
jgi:hypothetical protein